jgi:phenylalanyl-tRNA synthetase beta chain
LLNPLSAEESLLRRDLLGGLVRSVERNWAVRERDIRLFEFGAVFKASGAPLPNEAYHLAAVVTGARTPPHWSGSGKVPDYDLWDLKALFLEAVRLVGAGTDVVATDDGWELRHPDGRRSGWAGPLSADRPAWAAPLYGFELEMIAREHDHVPYVAVPTTPPVERDLALVLPDDVTAAAVDAVIREVGGPLLADVVLFDEYRGKDLAGRSVAWRLVFRAPDRTLREQEVDSAVDAILAALKERTGVERRQT